MIRFIVKSVLFIVIGYILVDWIGGLIGLLIGFFLCYQFSRDLEKDRKEDIERICKF